MTDKLTMDDLAQFTGTETWYRHPLVPQITFTDGVRFMAEKGKAFWLVDEIALGNRFLRKVRAQPFQVWKLKRDAEGNGAELAVEDGNDHVVHKKRIEYTDFPLPEVVVWFTDNVILLPGEY